MTLRYCIIETRLGWVGMAASEQGLSYTTLPQGSPQAALELLAESRQEMAEDCSAFGNLPQRLRRYFAGERVGFPYRLDLGRATPFLRAVYEATRHISYGQTRSYRWLANEVGRPRAFRAVGQAMARNPLPIIVPCHRVIASDGGLCGFGGGLELKRKLLDLEAQGAASR